MGTVFYSLQHSSSTVNVKYICVNFIGPWAFICFLCLSYVCIKSLRTAAGVHVQNQTVCQKVHRLQELEWTVHSSACKQQKR